MKNSKLIVYPLVFTFAVLTALSSGGCAFGDRVVALDYDSSKYCSKSNQQLEIYIASILDASPNELKRVSFKDSQGTRVKKDGKKIGSVKTDMGLKLPASFPNPLIWGYGSHMLVLKNCEDSVSML